MKPLSCCCGSDQHSSPDRLDLLGQYLPEKKQQRISQRKQRHCKEDGSRTEWRLVCQHSNEEPCSLIGLPAVAYNQESVQSTEEIISTNTTNQQQGATYGCGSCF